MFLFSLDAQTKKHQIIHKKVPPPAVGCAFVENHIFFFNVVDFLNSFGGRHVDSGEDREDVVRLGEGVQPWCKKHLNKINFDIKMCETIFKMNLINLISGPPKSASKMKLWAANVKKIKREIRL